MVPLFIQRYQVQQDIPVISMSSSGKPRQTGKVSQGEFVRGMIKNVKTQVNGQEKELELLQIASNKYIVPKHVVLERLSSADADQSDIVVQKNTTPSIILTLLPVVGLGLGLWFAHRNRDHGTTMNKAIAYAGYGALGLFVGSLPILMWSYNKTQRDFDKKTDDAANNQKERELTDRAYNLLNALAKKADKVIALDKDSFSNEFSELTTKEKEAFVYIAEHTCKLPVKDSKKYNAGVMAISKNASDKFGEDVIQSLSDKTTLPA